MNNRFLYIYISSLVSLFIERVLSKVKKSYFTNGDFYAKYFLLCSFCHVSALGPFLKGCFFSFIFGFAILHFLPRSLSCFSPLFLSFGPCFLLLPRYYYCFQCDTNSTVKEEGSEDRRRRWKRKKRKAIVRGK